MVFLYTHHFGDRDVPGNSAEIPR